MKIEIGKEEQKIRAGLRRGAILRQVEGMQGYLTVSVSWMG